MKLTLSELHAEYQYRVSERLGILCEDREPTPEQLQIAQSEADAWLKEYQRQFGSYRQSSMNL